MQEIDETIVAVNIFRSTYSALPGDYDNANSVWSTTTSGDGDGTVEAAEIQDVWDHLKAAGLAELDTLANAIPTKPFPDVKKQFWNIGTNTTFHGPVAQNSHVLQVGRAADTDDAAFVPRDQHKMDKKMDDGAPKAGKVTFRIAGTTTNASCTNSSTTYYLSSTTEGCNIVCLLYTSDAADES